MDSAAPPGGGGKGAVGTWVHMSKGFATLDIDDDAVLGPAVEDGGVVDMGDSVLIPLASEFDIPAAFLRASKRSSGV